LVGIPGTVGGALHGNAGTANGDIGQNVRHARLLTIQGNTIEAKGAQLQFSHHKSSLDEIVILQVEFALSQHDVRALTQRMQTLWIVKRSAQPSLQTSTAIPFLDPDTGSAAELIELTGMNGAAEGNVRLSSTHPNFLITSEGATSQQVLALLMRVQEAVQQRTGTTLQFHLTIW
jgi:UDP-N-acetylmuramate dehydrogenase